MSFFLRFLGDNSSLGKRQRQRLLAVDVFLGSGRHDARDCVPVVRSGDHHGIDLLKGEQFAEIVERLAAFVGILALLLAVMILDRLLGAIAALGDHVAYGKDLNLFAAKERAQVPAPHRADADEPEIDPLARRRIGRVEARREQQRPGRPRGGERLDELPARD